MYIFRYLFREVFGGFVAVSFILFLIFVSGRFVKYLAEAASGSFSSDVLLQIMLYRVPGFLELILPIALFVSIMLAYGRLYVESEMIVLQACGFSKKRLLAYTMGPALIVTVMVFMMSTYLTPLGWKKFHEVWNDPSTFNGIGTLVEGGFRKLGSEGSVIYVEELNDQKTEMSGVFIVSGQDDLKSMSMVRANSAVIRAESPTEKYIELSDGVQYQGALGDLNYEVASFGLWGQLISEPEETFIEVDSLDAKATLTLIDSADPKERAAFFWRVMMPLMIPVMALVAMALSETTHRKGRYMKLLPGIVTCIIYLGLLIAVRSEAEKETIDPLLGFLVVHVFFGVLGLIVMNFSSIRSRFGSFRWSAS